MTPKKRLELAPLPQSLQVITGFVVPQQQALILKETDKHWTRKHSRIHFMDDKNKPGARYGSVDEIKKNKSYSVQDINKAEIYKITRTKAQKDVMQFTATTTQGQVLWILDVDRHWTHSTRYNLRIHPGTPVEQSLELRKKFKGDQMAIMVNGMPAAVLGEKHTHWDREDEIHIAAGMDASLAIGIAYVHYLKGCMDEKDDWNIVDEVTGNVFG